MDDKVPKVMLKLLSKLMLTCRYRVFIFLNIFSKMDVKKLYLMIFVKNMRINIVNIKNNVVIMQVVMKQCYVKILKIINWNVDMVQFNVNIVKRINLEWIQNYMY